MFSRHTTRLAAAWCVIAFIATAFAPVATAAPASWDSIDVRLFQRSSGEPVAIVTGTLPGSVALPATVTLAVPGGITPEWVGEVLGGDLSQDPTRTFTTARKNGYDEIVFALTRARIGQVEYVDPAAITSQGQNSTATAKWTNPVPAPKVTLLIEVPQGAQVTSAGGAQKGTTSTGTETYSKTFSSVKAGQTLSLEVAYSGGASGATGQQGAQTATGGAAPPSGASGVSPIPFVLGAAVILGLIFFFDQRRRRAAALDETDEEEPESEPSDSSQAQE